MDAEGDHENVPPLIDDPDKAMPHPLLSNDNELPTSSELSPPTSTTPPSSGELSAIDPALQPGKLSFLAPSLVYPEPQLVTSPHSPSPPLPRQEPCPPTPPAAL